MNLDILIWNINAISGCSIRNLFRNLWFIVMVMMFFDCINENVCFMFVGIVVWMDRSLSGLQCRWFQSLPQSLLCTVCHPTQCMSSKSWPEMNWELETSVKLYKPEQKVSPDPHLSSVFRLLLILQCFY